MEGSTPTHYPAATDTATPKPSPCGHLVQFYSDSPAFLDSLESFIASGLDGGEAVIVIATPAHLHALEARLQARGLDLVEARNQNRYLPIGAEDALARFMVDGVPDADRFGWMVEGLLERARADGRSVRAFGEMVVLLWASGQRDAALHLERLWSRVCSLGELTLLCAYPTHLFDPRDPTARQSICSWHTDEIAHWHGK
jgi:hypothetical protein